MLVQVSNQDFNISLELRYATCKNFTGKPIYHENLQKTLIHSCALEKFSLALEQAKIMNLYFKIWDAFRPIEAQHKLWEYCPNDSYISNPKNGPRPHCRGVAFDLTLIDQSGLELDMGGEFDDFSANSHQGYLDLQPEQLKNRIMLAGIMHHAGFIGHPQEWWHFQLADIYKYPVIRNDQAPFSLLDT